MTITKKHHTEAHCQRDVFTFNTHKLSAENCLRVDGSVQIIDEYVIGPADAHFPLNVCVRIFEAKLTKMHKPMTKGNANGFCDISLASFCEQ